MLMAVLLCVALSLDCYILLALRARCRKQWPAKAYAVMSVVLAFLWGAILCMPIRGGGDDVLDTAMWMLIVFVSFTIPKFIFVVFDLLASIPRLWKGKRFKPLTMIGFILALLAFSAIWWGTLINRYRTQTVEEEIFIPNLPEVFDGYRLVQFSDFHVGTYHNDTTFVHKVVTEINSLHPDMIVFTGDIVSRKSSELTPFVNTLSHLHAPDGVYSILGNHDYGDYYNWITPEAKQTNMEVMYDLQRRMGWHLLNNESVEIHRGNDSIVLIGVENIGDPPFPRYGNLEEAYPTPGDERVKILLSHNPAHWVEDIANNAAQNVTLTLAGHTHAMQIAALGKSPASMRYKTWGGLYADKDGRQQLYVNIGVGTVGIPMRIGATPEITVLTLRKGNPSPDKFKLITNND